MSLATILKCDQLYQNPPLTYARYNYGKEQFHNQWIAPSLITSTPLPKADRSAYAEACF